MRHVTVATSACAQPIAASPPSLASPLPAADELAGSVADAHLHFLVHLGELSLVEDRPCGHRRIAGGHCRAAALVRVGRHRGAQRSAAASARWPSWRARDGGRGRGQAEPVVSGGDQAREVWAAGRGAPCCAGKRASRCVARRTQPPRRQPPPPAQSPQKTEANLAALFT